MPGARELLLTVWFGVGVKNPSPGHWFPVVGAGCSWMILVTIFPGEFVLWVLCSVCKVQDWLWVLQEICGILHHLSLCSLCGE